MGNPESEPDETLIADIFEGNSHFESPSQRKAQIQGQDGIPVSTCPQLVGGRENWNG